MKLILLGYMGSGKSILGKQLASALGARFVDLDTEIERQEEMSISTLFREKGEIYFRKREGVVLHELLELDHKLVLATGGGTPCYGTIMQDINKRDDVITVYLQCSINTLTHRLFKEKSQRPLIAHLETEQLLNDFIRKHLFERAFYYQQASIKINGDDRSVNEMVEELILRLF